MTTFHPLGLTDEGKTLQFQSICLGITAPPGTTAVSTPTGLRLTPPGGSVAIHLPGLNRLLSMNRAAWLDSEWWDLTQKIEEPIATPMALEVSGCALGIGAEQGRASVLAHWDPERETLRFTFDGRGEAQMWFSATDSVAEALEGIAIAMMEEVMPITPLRGAQFGWMSWDELRAGVAQEDIVAHADFIAENLGGEQAIVLIDDGWQIAAGDWAPNAKFDKGMPWITDEIHQRGLRAGLWIAPFMVALTSPLAKEHPEWLLRDEAGEFITPQDFPQWGGASAVLDVTQREVVEWLRHLVDGVAGWGFDYIKFDFLANSLLGISKNETIPRAVAYRDAVRAMRQVLGPQITVMGCGTPLIEGRGLFDAARVGDDVVTDWKLLRSRLTNIAVRHPLHRRWWWNDPDNVVVREPFTITEGQMWATAVAISEGNVFLGDDLRNLDAERLRIGQSIWPPAFARCKPLGMGRPVFGEENIVGQCWVAETEKGRVVALMNWQDTAQPLEVNWGEIGIDPTGPCHAWEYWTREHLGVVTGELKLEVPAHTAHVVALTPVAAVPQVVGCDRHLVVGALGLFGVRWDEESATLAGRVEEALPKVPTEIVVAVPGDRGVGKAQGAESISVEKSGDLSLVTLRVEGNARWSLECPRG